MTERVLLSGVLHPHLLGVCHRTVFLISTLRLISLAMSRSGALPDRMENAARGYLLTARGYQPWWMDKHLDGLVGDGGVFSTAEDLRAFSQAEAKGQPAN